MGRITNTYPATSGPFGQDELEQGNYTGRNLRRRSRTQRPGMACPGAETGWSLDLEPNFRTTRTLLRIHPDGGRRGTAGCIGVLCSSSESLYNDLLGYFDEGHTSIPVDVLYTD